MRRFTLFALTLVTACGIASAQDGTLSFSGVVADDDFYAFLSTDNSVLGSDITSTASSGGSVSLDPGQTYFLQIESLNYGGAGGFAGVFSLDPSFQFTNGTQTLDTSASNAQYWSAAYGGTIPELGEPLQEPWVTPSVSAIELTGGIPFHPGVIWASDSNSSPNGYAWGDQCTECYVTLSAEITPTTPEPSTGLLIAPVAFGIYGWRRRRMRRA